MTDLIAVGTLSVWWIPQIPGDPFRVTVRTLAEARLLIRTLAAYDAFQYEHNIKPDYCNAGGLNVWSSNSDGEGHPGWIDWVDADGRDFNEIPDEDLDAVWEEAND